MIKFLNGCKLLLFYTFLALVVGSPAVANMHTPAKDITYDATDFPDPSDDDVQSAIDYLATHAAPGGVNWGSIGGTITNQNWASITPYLNRGAMNWPSLNKDIQTSGINWSSVINSEVQGSGINWSSENIFVNGVNGNIGIGTSKPGTLLSIGTSSSNASPTKNAFNIDSSGNITNLGGQQANINAVTVDLTNGGGAVRFGNNSSFPNSYTNIHSNGTGGFITFSPESDVEKVRINHDGNIGIGTIAPAYALDVAGYEKIYGIHTPNDIGGITSAAGLIFDPTGAGTLMILDANRNVGIGVLTPGTALDVSGTVRATTFLGDGSGLTGIGSGGWTTNSSTKTTTLYNVGIGSVSPGKQLDVQGTVRATAFLGDGSGLTGIGAASGWTTDSATKTTTTYNVGIGSTNPGKSLDVQGTVRMTGFAMSAGAGSSKVLTSDSSGNGTWATVGAASAAGGTNAVQYNSGSSTFAGNEAIFAFTGSNVGIGSATPGQILDVSGTVRILGNGNLGIGTASPGQLLDVNGGIRSISSGVSYYNSNVGIGTTIPPNPLYVVGTPMFTTGLNIGIGTTSLTRLCISNSTGVVTCP